MTVGAEVPAPPERILPCVSSLASGSTDRLAPVPRAAWTRAAVIAGLVALTTGCHRGSPAPETKRPPPHPKRHATAWEKLVPTKADHGEFMISTPAASTPAPLSDRRCALWSLMMEGAPDGGTTRVFFDEWPKSDAVLVVDGVEMPVPQTQIRIAETSAKKEFRAADPDLPDYLKRMFTSPTWVDKGQGRPPASATGVERCLAPATTYRARLTSHTSETMNYWGTATKSTSYELAITPLP